MHDDILELIKNVNTGEADSDGYAVIQRTSKEVFCKVNDPGRSEFYQAARADMKVEKVFTVSALDYESETELVYEEHSYKVTRTYPVNSDEIELVCSSLEA